MNINFRYIFEKRGAIAPDHILENDLWIDVGNVVKDGVFDHHQDGSFGSAFECVMKRTDCYEHIKLYLAQERENLEVVIHVHESPDLDCLFSIFAVQRMIREHKENPAEAFDENVAEILLNYVNTIDSGRGKHMSKITLYMYFCRIGVGLDYIKGRSWELVDEGLKLLELVVKRLEETIDGVDLFESSLDEYIDISTLKYYGIRQSDLEKINEDYQNDKRENRVILKYVNLWNAASKSMKPVKAAIWEKLPSGKDEYIFANDEDECLLTVYPYKIKEENSSEGVTRVMIALNPNKPETRNFSLIPLAEVIEQCEQEEEELLFERTGRYRRDHSQPRKEGGRFDEIPFLETSDPWFFSENGELIDSPRVNSILPYRRILTIIENASSMTKRVSFLHYRGENGQINIEKTEELGEISFGDLYRETRDKLKKQDPGLQHLFAFVKIDASMIRYSNQWFRICCLNMVGKNGCGLSQVHIFQIDYRTCLYTDQSITILIAADGRTQSLSSLINEEILEKSRICIDLKNVLEHRLSLRSIGLKLSDAIQKLTQDSEEIDRFNEKLVRLNTRIEKDDLIAEPLEQEVYSFIKEALEIETLKNSVTTSAQLLIKNAEQLRDRRADKNRREQMAREKLENEREAKRDGRIQAGIGLVTIFAIFSAWADAFDFIAKLVPGSDGGWSEVLHCWPVLVLELAVTLFISILGCVAGKYIFQAWHGATADEADEKNADNEKIGRG